MIHRSALRSTLTGMAATAIFLGLAFMTSPASAIGNSAATITVTSLGDANGVCPDSVNCTLRTAIETATRSGQPTTISFAVSGTITVSSVLKIGSPAGQPNLVIDGANRAIVIDGGQRVQIFSVFAGSNVTLNSLTLQNGYESYGGAIANDGNLTISNSVIANNVAGNGCCGGYGGGIFNNSKLTILNSTISGNQANANSAGGGHGGGIFNIGWLSISSSTLSGNSADIGGGALNIGNSLIMRNSTLSGNSARQGAALTTGTAIALIDSSTFSANAASSEAGGIYVTGGKLTLLNTIVAGNTAGKGSDFSVYYGNVASLGHNLIGNGSGTGLMNGVNGDQIGTSAAPISPVLAALTLNGGSTQTMALFANSPALGTGDCSGTVRASASLPALNTDQRNIARASACDMGAYQGSTTNANPTAIVPPVLIQKTAVPNQSGGNVIVPGDNQIGN